MHVVAIFLCCHLLFDLTSLVYVHETQTGHFLSVLIYGWTAGFLRSAVPSYGLWQSHQDLQLSNRPLKAAMDANRVSFWTLSLSLCPVNFTGAWFKWIVTMFDWAKQGTLRYTEILLSRRHALSRLWRIVLQWLCWGQNQPESLHQTISGSFQTLNVSISFQQILKCEWFCQVCHNGQQLLAPMSLKPRFRNNHWPFWMILWCCDLARPSSTRPFLLREVVLSFFCFLRSLYVLRSLGLYQPRLHWLRSNTGLQDSCGSNSAPLRVFVWWCLTL